MKTKSGHMSVAELREQMENETLMVNRAYQRAAGLWPTSAKSYFIDTLLNEFPFQSVTYMSTLARQRSVLKKIS
jgi:hypothetical protein